MLNYYFYNAELKMAATMEWVVDYLYFGEARGTSQEEIKENLLEKTEYFGWIEIEVSNDIDEKFD